MNIRYRVDLNEAERTQLTALLGGKHAARKLKRAQILMAADAGIADEEIASSVLVGGSTVYRTKRRFVEGNLALALLDRCPGRSRRPCRRRSRPRRSGRSMQRKRRPVRLLFLPGWFGRIRSSRHGWQNARRTACAPGASAIRGGGAWPRLTGRRASGAGIDKRALMAALRV